jgi:hypothetical protein
MSLPIPALAEVHEFLSHAKVHPSGPPLVRYLVMDYNIGSVEVDIGLPVPVADLLDRRSVRPGTLPTGTREQPVYIAYG